MTPELSTQKRLGNVLFYGIAILVVYAAYLVFEPFLAPLAWATVLVVVTHPLHVRLSKRLSPSQAAFASAAGVTLILIVPTIFVLIGFVQQAVGAVRSVRLGMEMGHYAWVNNLWIHLQSRFPKLIPADLGNLVRGYAERSAEYIAGRAGEILRNTAEFIFDLGITILAMFYFFRDGESMVGHLRNALPFDEVQRERIVGDTQSLIFATVASTLVAAVAHGLLGGAAFALTGIQAPVFWGVLMGFLSLIPLIGTALVWVPLSVSLILGGHLANGIILAIFCSVVVGMVDNFLRPLLISGRAQMSTLLIFVGVLGGIKLFGLLGAVLGPIIIATAATLLDFHAPGGNTGSKAIGRGKHAVLE